MKTIRKGFTLVELMTVIAIMAILSGILMNVAIGAIRSSRTKRTEAMRVMLESAIATYYAQEGKWPAEIETKADNNESAVLTDDAAQKVFREIVKISAGKKGQANPLVDPNGLFVARTGVKDAKGYGLSYSDARAGDGNRRQKIGVDQMVFGYQGKKSGRFRRFRIIYHSQSDAVEVSICCEHCIQCELGKITCKDPPTVGGFPNPDKCKYCHLPEDDK